MLSVEFLITAFVVVIAPGTGVIYTLATGLARGRTAAIAAAFGCTLGILPHMLAVILGLAAILHASALAFQLVKIAGVLFLLWMAWQILRDAGPMSLTTEAPPRGHTGVAVRGALINILNPKLSLFFLAFLPQFLSGQAAQATFEMTFLGLIFMAMTFVVFVIYGIFAASARRHVLGNPRTLQVLRYGFAATFAGLGLKLALQRI
ncbi:MAG: LysE family translocator [Rhodobacter sp.]|jgi:threonine/homoserine/homoserine lactone efflux protein|nr:LysE family translocator [Rhodobacter sp.]